MTDSNTKYVEMGGESQEAVNVAELGINLSQEEIDHGLALALQQQENNSAYDASKKRHEKALAAQNLKTGRSCVGAIPPPKKQQMQHNTALMVEKIIKTDAALNASSQTRNARSGSAAFKK